MNTLLTHAHTLVLKLTFDEFDSATFGSIILGIGDIAWLTFDVMKNGFNPVYAFIMLTFFIGNVLLVIGLHQHHVKSKNVKVNKAKRLRRTKAQMRLDVERELNGIS